MFSSKHLSFSRRMVRGFVALGLLALAATSGAQTFRGGISGRVVDESGAVLPGVTVTAIHTGTGATRTTTTSSAGAFSLPDLALGTYKIEATLAGFQGQRVTLEVVVSKISAVEFKMGVSGISETVEVTGTGAKLDTVSTALANVVGPQQVQDFPLNGRDFRRMLQLTPGVAQNNSVNGAGTRGNNYQIDGADNNDAFHNTSAVNQGGVSGIAGTLLPIEAIDQFAVQSSGSSESGRNGGSTVNLVIKSGTNAFHGSAFYFNRHESLSASSPVLAPGIPKRPIRNNQFGFSLGGPIVKDKTFFFATFEGQKLTAGNTLVTTSPSDAWIASARQRLAQFGVAENPVSLNLLSLWPADSRTAPATANNFTSTDNNVYDSYNGVAKLDHAFNSKYSVSARYFGGTGDQTASDGGSPFLPYYQSVPSRMHNVSVVPTAILSPNLVNQLVIGYNYFYQTFDMNDANGNPAALGLNTGVTDPELYGPPRIAISGFGIVGGSALLPAGRIDATWHITDTLSYSTGAHQIKVGGEYRRAKLDIFYDSLKRGGFTFDGTVGPWGTSGTAADRALADFLAGYVAVGNILRGPTRHDYYQNSFDLFAHDAWTIRPSLTVNFGLRYTNQGVLGAVGEQLTNFQPDQGLVRTDQLYPKDNNNLAPRAGFAYTPGNGKTVFRGGYGIYFNVLPGNYFTANTFPNGGSLGVGHQPGGPTPVYTITQRRFTLVKDVPVFGTSPSPPYGAFSVSQDLKLPYLENFNFNIQRQLTNSTVLQAGYVGMRGHGLGLMRNINAPALGTAGTLQSRRPFNARYPQLGAINELSTTGRSRYDSLQVSLVQSRFHGVSGRLNYTYGHVKDDVSDARNNVVMNAYDVAADFGDSTGSDVRHIFTAGLSYEVPVFHNSRLGEGWQLNLIASLESGIPFNVTTGTDTSRSGDLVDRAAQVGDPFSGIVQPAGLFPRFFNASAFAAPPSGTFSALGRNAFHGPSFRTVDLSIFKTTKLSGGVSAQLRCEIFNILNITNWANPGSSLANSTTFGLLTATRNGGGAPGIGSGEPRNIQLAVKVLF